MEIYVEIFKQHSAITLVNKNNNKYFILQLDLQDERLSSPSHANRKTLPFIILIFPLGQSGKIADKIEYPGGSGMYGGGTGSGGYGVGLGPGAGPSHYIPSATSVGYQLPPPPLPPACPSAGNQLLTYGTNLSPHHMQQTHAGEAQQSKRRR